MRELTEPNWIDILVWSAFVGTFGEVRAHSPIPAYFGLVKIVKPVSFF